MAVAYDWSTERACSAMALFLACITQLPTISSALLPLTPFSRLSAASASFPSARSLSTLLMTDSIPSPDGSSSLTCKQDTPSDNQKEVNSFYIWGLGNEKWTVILCRKCCYLLHYYLQRRRDMCDCMCQDASSTRWDKTIMPERVFQCSKLHDETNIRHVQFIFVIFQNMVSRKKTCYCNFLWLLNYTD